MKSAVAIECFSTINELKAWRAGLAVCSAAGTKRSVGLVPTMGALHEGHMTLVKQALAECQNVIVSVFVNPLQFGPAEDLAKYPRTLQSDIDLCRNAGVHAVFHPSDSEMYPQGREGNTVIVPPADLTERLCGSFRPGHFVGVATVVAKLFSLVQPDAAYFGEKDFQQLAVIKRMVSDLNTAVDVVGVPTVREPDGLALSSRNVYLTAEQRKQAPILFQTLCQVRDRAKAGERSMSEVLEEGREAISNLSGVKLQYLEACCPDTLFPVNSADGPFVVLVAAKFGEVRLIDNLPVR